MQKHTLNAIGHFDVAGPDLQKLSAFYSEVFGWAVENKGPGYALLTTPGNGINGALVESESASLTVGVVVADLDLALAAALKAGGAVVMPKTDNGWVKKGQVTDPAGNVITLIEG